MDISINRVNKVNKEVEEIEEEHYENYNNEELFALLDEINYDKYTKEINNIENSINYCSACRSLTTIVEDAEKGNIICSKCGSILEVTFDKNPEWRSFKDDNSVENGRCSFVTSHFLPQSSLGTTIGSVNMSRIKKLHSWSAMPYKERSLYLVLKEIQDKCRSAKILKCIEDDAKILYKNISECRHIKGKNLGKLVIIRGKNRKSLIAACIYFACKRKGNTLSPKEIATLFSLQYKDITKGCKTFIKLMKLRKMSYEFNTSTPEHFVNRFCKSLNIKRDYIDITLNIAKNIKKLNIASVHTPLSIATGSILLMVTIYKLPITKKAIANKFNVSEVTVTKAFRKLEIYKNILINTELTDKLVVLLEEENKKIPMPQKLIDRYNSIKLRFDTNINNFDINYINQLIANSNAEQEAITNEYVRILNKNNSIMV
jgi:transcription initiation factor TFIIIB Brf1 subunit/transcription initiation factor TFIIB